MTDDRKPADRAAGPRSALARFDEVDVTIEKLIAGGDGLARHDGLPVFVARSAPGDRARVRVTERKTGYARAEIVDLLEEGPGRRTPPCRHFGDCGGCDLQHLEDGLQTDLKVAATVETLERLGRLELPEPSVVRGAPWAYRIRTQLHGSARADQEGADRAVIGYRARGSHRLVEIEECPVLVEDLERAARRLPALLAPETPRRVDLTVGSNGDLSCAPVIEGLPHGEVSTRVGAFDYAYDARCFFQGHRELLPELVDAVVGPAAGRLAVDLFAGVGLFSLPLAGRYERVIAVEGDRIAARFARLNARRNGLSNVETEHQAVESWIPRLERGVDRVVVDPPRSGLSRAVVARLREARPERISYVSCHPAALARDLRALRPTHEIVAVTMVDLFPQTGHIEVVAQLDRRD